MCLGVAMQLTVAPDLLVQPKCHGEAEADDRQRAVPAEDTQGEPDHSIGRCAPMQSTAEPWVSPSAGHGLPAQKR